jgi:hypothetical protein
MTIFYCSRLLEKTLSIYWLTAELLLTLASTVILVLSLMRLMTIFCSLTVLIAFRPSLKLPRVFDCTLSIRSDGRVIYCWPSQAQSFLVPIPVVLMTMFYWLSRLLVGLKWGLLFDEWKGLTTTVHSPSNGEWLFWLSLSLTHSLSVLTQLTHLGAASLLSHYSGFQP